MKKAILTETLFLRRHEVLEKKLGCKFIRIRVKKAIMQTMKSVEYKHLLVTLKTEN